MASWVDERLHFAVSTSGIELGRILIVHKCTASFSQSISWKHYFYLYNFDVSPYGRPKQVCGTVLILTNLVYFKNQFM